MSSDNSTSVSPPPSNGDLSPPPPDASAPPPPDTSAPPPSTTTSPPPPADASPPPPADASPPPPADASPPPPEVSPPPAPSAENPPSPPAPSNSGNNSTSAPPPEANSSPATGSSPPPDNGENKSPPKSGGKSKEESPAVPSKSGRSHLKGDSPQLADKSSSKDDEKSLIAGAAAGAGLLLLLMIVFVVSCARRKKRKKHNHELKYYSDHPNMKNYYNNGQNWQNKQPNDLMVKIPGGGGLSSEHGWAAGPPPPPMMHSSEMSSSGFSGPHGAALPPPHPGVALGFNQSSFTYEDLAAATGGFAQANLLGQGGFGYVHKGVLPNGKEIAVKSLKSNSGQGEREFQAEVDIISRVHHRHLVSLVGWCSTGSQRMLVYEFVPNGTLEYHLYGAGRPTMDWPTRLKIALGSAKGFAYLHEDCHPRIIHRDIKAANILIDSNFEAKVADFGLAKLSSDNNTHVSTRIMGTFGYLAPEYASSGKLTEKSDVYSFGVMLLELITGRRPIDINTDDDTLVDWARPILMKVNEGGGYEELVDPRLGNNYDPQEMLHMVACAGACIKHSARARPKMSQIVRALEGDVSLDDLNAGSRGSMLSSNGSDYDLKRFGKGGVLSSQEFTSSDEGNTGEFRR